MAIRYAVGALAALLGLAPPAGAQQRVLVVPAGAVVAVPARGAPPAAAGLQPRPRLARLAPPVAEPDAAIPPAAALLPLAAAAALAATLSGRGGGGGVSAPARTR